jgi:hypothetical protein
MTRNPLPALGGPLMAAKWMSVAACVAWAGWACADAPFKRLMSAEIGKSVSGREITDGSHWSDRFMSNGLGSFTTLGRRKQGHWLVRGDELCMIRAASKSQAEECFEVWRSGRNVQYRLGNGAVVAEGVLRSF